MASAVAMSAVKLMSFASRRLLTVTRLTAVCLAIFVLGILLRSCLSCSIFTAQAAILFARVIVIIVMIARVNLSLQVLPLIYGNKS